MEELKSMIGKLGKNITKTSKEIIKTTKLSIKLSAEEDKLKNLYIEIGKKVCEIYSYGGNIGEFFDKKYKEKIEIEKEIAYIKEKIEETKTKTSSVEKTEIIDTRKEFSDVEECLICNACGQKNNVGDNFCIKCGRNL